MCVCSKILSSAPRRMRWYDWNIKLRYLKTIHDARYCDIKCVSKTGKKQKSWILRYFLETFIMNCHSCLHSSFLNVTLKCLFRMTMFKNESCVLGYKYPWYLYRIFLSLLYHIRYVSQPEPWYVYVSRIVFIIKPWIKIVLNLRGVDVFHP